MSDLPLPADPCDHGITSEASGILRDYGVFGGKKTPVWKVIVNGQRDSMWTRRRQARAALREARKEQRL